MLLKVGKHKMYADVEVSEKHITLKFAYNKTLLDEVKAMVGAKWHPNAKKWTATNCQRNLFQLAYLMGKNPYARYDSPIVDVHSSPRPLFDVQKESVSFILQRRRCILAEDMGLGKTLSFIEAAEAANLTGAIWYVGPRSGVRAVSRELSKWDAAISVEMHTYNKLVSKLQVYSGQAPQFVCFDESSHVKTPTSQRSIAAMHLADSMRAEWGNDAYIVLMTGTPAPKTPLDFWHQCEIACPGFIKEGTYKKFEKRLGLFQLAEQAWGTYYKRITWWDDERKCKTCGEIHAPAERADDHYYHKSVNEVAALYKRMEGLVIVRMAKDCLDLPERREEIIKVKPTIDVIRALNLIKSTSDRAIQVLTLSRELSDGFQYYEKADGSKPCPACKIGSIPDPLHEGARIPCPTCNGTLRIPKIVRDVRLVPTPKDEAFTDLLHDYEEIGRFIVWGGFTATVDKLTKLARKHKWTVLQVDGRGYKGIDPEGNSVDTEVLLSAMDYSDKNYNALHEQYPTVCFVGNPGAGGMALTLTGSPVMLYYSNTFNGVDRMQSEKRAERAGMRKDLGLIIYDLVHLSTDMYVLENIRTKKNLQSLAMGELQQYMEEYDNGA